jgi:hypothetical protein
MQEAAKIHFHEAEVKMSTVDPRRLPKALLGGLIGIGVWWLVPLLMRLSSGAAGAAPLVLPLLLLLSLGVTLPVCAENRNAEWVVLIWIPAFLWNAIGAGAMWLECLGAFGVMFGGEAIVITGVFAIGLSIATVLLVFRHPLFDFESRSMAFAILAIVNTAAVSYATREATFRANRQDVVVRILDSKGAPLSDATVSYKVYGYGDRGNRPSEPDITGGPISSDGNGVVRLRSMAMRHEMDGVISKPGFRQISFNLGMQYDEWNCSRDLKILTDKSGEVSRLFVPSKGKEPVAFSIYLPPESDTPRGIQFLEGNIGVEGTGSLRSYLDVETGKFNKDPSGDLQIDASFTFDGHVRRDHLMVTGINGASVLAENPSVYERTYLIAPESGYKTSLFIENGDVNEIYVRARNGRLFARVGLEIIAQYPRSGEEWSATVYSKVYVNPGGSRLLESRRM